MTPAPIPFNEIQGMAEAIAGSGLFGMKTANQALALMLVAQAEGQHPATITQEYDIIQGRAARKTHSVLARFQAAGGTVEWHELTDATADATFKHRAGGALRMTWTFEQAKKAGLVGKDNWKNYPRAMLRARCIAEGVRAVYPAALGGMLVSEEAQDMPVVEKDMGAAEVVSSRPAQPATLPEYPPDAFAQNFVKWGEAIKAGKLTAEDVITRASTKGILTAEQKAAIHAAAKPKPNPEPEIIDAPAEAAQADDDGWLEDYESAEVAQ